MSGNVEVGLLSLSIPTLSSANECYFLSALFKARLDGHRSERLQKKLCVDPVQSDLDMKRKIVDIMEKAERCNSARLDTIAEAHVRMSNSFDVLVRHLCQPQLNRAPPMQYYIAP